MDQGKRYIELDVIKGIGILLMTLGHIGIGGAYSLYTRAFNMPMFFIISGYLFNSATYNTEGSKVEKIRKGVRKYYRKLMYPYFLWSIILNVIYICICLIEKGTIRWETVIHSFWRNNVTDMPFTGPLWFLSALFFVTCIHLIAVTLISEKMRICVPLLMMGMTLFISNQKTGLPYSIDSAIMAYAFFYLGNVSSEKKAIEKINNYMSGRVTLYGVFIIFFAINFVSIWKNDGINVRTVTYGNSLLSMYGNGIIATILYYCIARFLVKKWTHLAQILTDIGKDSMIYMVFNSVAVLLSKRLLPFLGVNAITKLISLCVVLAFLKLLCIFFHKRKLMALFGRS